MSLSKLTAVIIAFILCLAIPQAMATVLDFQSASDMNYINCTAGSSSCSLSTNATGGNQNLVVTSSAMTNLYANPMTYAAGTLLVGNNPSISLYDSSMSVMYSTPAISTGTGRYEINVIGGFAYIYKNGNLLYTSTALTQNPSYVSFGATGGSNAWDDIIWGSSENRYTIGMPAPYGYYLKKDMVNPASSGFYNATTGSLIDSNYFESTWARGNITFSGNESIYLINKGTGTVYGTGYTGNATTGTSRWRVSDLLFASAPYGIYEIKFDDYHSDDIIYIANGANIAFDSDQYSQGDSATVTWLVDAAYWLPGEYTYRIDIVDVYGTVHHTESIASSSGSMSFTWDSDADDQGVYYAEIIADRISDGEDLLMNFDYATLSSYFGFAGYVNAAQTALPIAAANVTYAQGDTIDNTSSGFDGNYSVSGFLTGIQIWANISATGYVTQNFTFTVMSGHTITRNITLNETSPSYVGLGIGGVARDGVFTSPNSITNGYGRPIPSPLCYLQNTTHSESYSTTGNNAGGYLFDESTSAFLTSGRVYDLWCNKTGYSNSSIYQVVAA